jgi:hypothetical protein
MDEELIEMRERGFSFDWIAEKLGTTPKSARVRAAFLGLDTGNRHRETWAPGPESDDDEGA